jgi:hypothetical protein
MNHIIMQVTSNTMLFPLLRVNIFLPETFIQISQSATDKISYGKNIQNMLNKLNFGSCLHATSRMGHSHNVYVEYNFVKSAIFLQFF